MTDRSIIEAAARLRRHREPYLVATVVSVEGAAYRGPGARMLLTRFRWVAGSVTGGCLEGDVANEGWWRTRDGEPVLIAYDADCAGCTDDDIRSAFGLGCDGTVCVLVERGGLAGRIDALEFAGRCLRTNRRGAVATVFRAGGCDARVGARLALADGGELEEESEPIAPALRERIAADLRTAIRTGVSSNRTYPVHGAGDGAGFIGGYSVLVEAILPPPRLFLFGTGHDAVPVAHLARQIGWDVIVCTSQPRCSTRDRFPGADELVIGSRLDLAARIDESDRAVAVLMNHDLGRDRDCLALLLDTRIHYIGMLGPRARARRMLRDLGCDDEDPRVHAPVGLELSAQAPQALALAIVAELQAVLARTGTAQLRDPTNAWGEIPPDCQTGNRPMAAFTASALARS